MTNRELPVPTLQPRNISPAAVALDTHWKMAKVVATSDLVPEAYRNKPANCLVAIDTANRLGVGWLEIMQNMGLFKGKPAWTSAYIIGRANSSGVFRGPIRFATLRGDEAPGGLAVRAYATVRETGDEVERIVGMDMAMAEGWAVPKGRQETTKYQTMPEQMLSYRAATFLIRLYCPEVMLGSMQTREEAEDVDSAREVSFDIVPPNDEAVAAFNAELEQEGAGGDEPAADERTPAPPSTGPPPPSPPGDPYLRGVVPMTACECEGEDEECPRCGGSGEVPAAPY